MKVSELVKSMDLKVIAGESELERDFDGVYIGDLLSWVMGKLRADNVWITIQGHLNIVAVANLADASCIIVAEGAEVNPDTVAKADSMDIPILTTSLSIYDTAKALAKLEGAV